MIDYTSIFRKRISNMVNEGNADYIKTKIREYRKLMSPKSGERKFFNRENLVLELIRKRKWEKAVSLIKESRLNAFSIFNNVEIYGNSYSNIPFVVAALGIVSEKSKNADSISERIIDVISEVFQPSGINSRNMFDAKFMTANGHNDIISFIFTHDGQIKNKKRYDQNLDLDVLTLLNAIISKGYTLANNKGIVEFILKNDLIASIKFLIENGIYIPSQENIKDFSLSTTSNVGRLLGMIAEHPFKLHAPEIEYDDKGKFSGGSFYQTFKNVGYDISKKEKIQKIHLSICWMIRDAIANAIFNYRNSGENFSNETDINLFQGSEFDDATEKLKYLCSEYYKYIQSKNVQEIEKDDKKEYSQTIVKSVNCELSRLENGLNAVLSKIDLPQIEIVMQNKLGENSGKIIYKTSSFMKEIWNSVKIAK